MNICRACHTPLKKYQKKYCSNSCQATTQYLGYIQEWKRGGVSGCRGILAKNISGFIVRYLREKYGEKCSLCGWNRRNTATKRVPLEIDHIDGNSENNKEENLRLICPNCHSLSSNFRNLNKGFGRVWRKHKYLRSSQDTRLEV